MGWALGRVMIEQDPGARKQRVGIAVICDQPMRRSLRRPIGASRPKRGVFCSGDGVLRKQSSEEAWHILASSFNKCTASSTFGLLLKALSNVSTGCPNDRPT
jgi:hypothetical protein